MNNDRILKKSLFGGFKKEDVLNYVEKLQNENVSLASELREKSAECAELSNIKDDYDGLKNNCEAMASRVSELSSSECALSDANAELTQRANKAEALYEGNLHELETLKSKCTELAENQQALSDANAELTERAEKAESLYERSLKELEVLRARCAELEESNAASENTAQLNSELEAKVLGAQADAASLESELSETKEKYSALEAEYARLSEEKSSALIQSAMKYSDSLISEANETANKVIGEAGSSIGGASGEITEAGERLKTAQFNLECSLNSVRGSVDALLETLSKCSSELTSGD